MMYSINIHPYNDPYIAIGEEAMEAIAELLVPGAFFVDIIPILKYVPEWFPGAKFQTKAAMMRKHAAIIRNTTFAATEELMVMWFITFFSDSFNWWYVYLRSQAGSDYDPSSVTEVLREIQYSDTPIQDIKILKDVAVQAYLG